MDINKYINIYYEFDDKDLHIVAKMDKDNITYYGTRTIPKAELAENSIPVALTVVERDLERVVG